jgi:hypothetical protein
MFPFAILTNTKKNTSKANHFSSKYGGSKIQKEIPNVLADAKTSVHTSIR